MIQGTNLAGGPELSDVPYRLIMIGSGSKGNSLLVAGERARILIDMGFPQYRVLETLRANNLAPSDLDALFITHTHGDHVNVAAINFCWRHKITLVAARENLAVLHDSFGHPMQRLQKAGLVRVMTPEGLDVGPLGVLPFEVPHDSRGLSFGYQLTLGGGGASENPVRLGVATDLGFVPPEVYRVLSQCQVLVLESNHDPQMLLASGRPQLLIDRIRGQRGHLSNHQATEMVKRIAAQCRPGHMQHLVLSHLSEECNTAALALESMQGALCDLGRHAPKVSVAEQHQPLVFRDGVRCGSLFD